MKFDYEAVEGAITKIESAITVITETIATKIPSTTYKNGNAKEAVDSYIESLNKCFDGILPEIQKIKNDIQQVRDTYFNVESDIKASLKDESATTTRTSANGNTTYTIN